MAVLESLSGCSVKEANSVVVANLGLLGNGLLHILDRGAGGKLDVLGEPFDGLLRSCAGDRASQYV